MNVFSLLQHGQLKRLTWNGDNRVFVVEELLPVLHLAPRLAQVIRWAYGYDGSDRSYEKESDGSTIVPDSFMLGLIKEPGGVSHDMLNRVKDHITPDHRQWTATEANAAYRDIELACGYSRARAWNRWLWLTMTIPFWWK